MGRSGSLDIPALPAPRGQWRAPQLTDCQLAAHMRNRTDAGQWEGCFYCRTRFWTE